MPSLNQGGKDHEEKPESHSGGTSMASATGVMGLYTLLLFVINWYNCAISWPMPFVYVNTGEMSFFSLNIFYW